MRPLAVTTLKRTAVLPDIPTIDELGIRGFDATTWHGLVAPRARRGRSSRCFTVRLAIALNDAAVQKIPRRSRGRYHRQHPGGVRRLHQIRNPEMDGNRQGVGSDARLTKSIDSMGQSIRKPHRPHPEEARSAVSKDGNRRDRASGRPFETPATRAPQDEAGGFGS